jgi:DNA-binding GntR family transcriptional regulator
VSDLKSQTIYRALRERILSNEILSGTRLVLRQLANEYDTSDIPVREALRMLERDGLVEMVPYRGARVTTLTAREIEETYFIRGHLESIATGLAAERISDAELHTLDELMTRMRAAVEVQDGPGFSDLNREFHATIIGACGNEMLRELTMDIMDALRARDPKRAAALALWHKRSVGDTVSTLVDDERPAAGGETA